MSSNLKVNTILPSTGSNIGIGTNGGELNVDGGCKVQVGTALTLGHSVGLQFATQNLHSAGFEINQINASGIITASSFSGSGANLTSLPAGQLTGALPAISGANLTGITGTTINNNADNRLITGSNSANTLEGEADLIFGADGDANVLRIAGGSSNISSSNHVSTKLQFRAKDPSTNSTNNIGASIDMIDESGNGSYQALRFQTFKQQLSPGLRETVRFTHDGHVNISDGDLKVASGHGIDFSATSDATSGMSNELLDDYEEGSWTPSVTTGTSSVMGNCRYVKIGRTVYITGGIQNLSDRSSSNDIEIDGLPFTCTSFETSVFTTRLSRVSQRSGTAGVYTEVLHNSTKIYPTCASNGSTTPLGIRHQDLHHAAAFIGFTGVYTTSA